MQVWIDRNCCTLHASGVCVDRCPDLFLVLEDGLGYVYDDGGVFGSLAVRVPVPVCTTVPTSNCVRWRRVSRANRKLCEPDRGNRSRVPRPVAPRWSW
jgi:ferredoxin